MTGPYTVLRGGGTCRSVLNTSTMERILIALGAVTGLLAVAAAAFAAHGLEGGAAVTVGRAVQMQGWHALALLACGLWAPRGGWLALSAGAAFALGALLFCGAVYLSVLGGVRLGPVAPAGGLMLMLGWALLGLSALRRR